VNLVIDFGNTRVKAALFNGDRLHKVFAPVNNGELKKLATESADQIIVSSVSISQAEINKIVTAPFLYLNHQVNLPFTLKYNTPQTLGLDRIAAIAGAQYLFPSTNCLAIDVGTCITYDFIDADRNYYGGAISPGVDMRFKSLNTFTANLPLVSSSDHPKLIGTSTKESIESGVILGITNEIDGFIRMYKEKYAHLQVILTGGDAFHFEKKLKEDIFAAPELVLTGLNRILLNNV